MEEDGGIVDEDVLSRVDVRMSSIRDEDGVNECMILPSSSPNIVLIVDPALLGVLSIDVGGGNVRILAGIGAGSGIVAKVSAGFIWEETSCMGERLSSWRFIFANTRASCSISTTT